MPIEIRELIIRATVHEDRETRDDLARPRAAPSPGAPAGALTAREFDRIVEACVQRLVRVQKRSDER